MGCLEELEEVLAALEVDLQLAAALSVMAVRLVVPEEDRVVKVEGELEEVEVVADERTNQHPLLPLWTPRWINTTRTEPQQKPICLQPASLLIPQLFLSSDCLVFFGLQTFAILFNTLPATFQSRCDVNDCQIMG